MGREEGPRGIERVGKGREGVDRADRKMMGGRDNGNGKGKGEKGKRGGKGIGTGGAFWQTKIKFTTTPRPVHEGYDEFTG